MIGEADRAYQEDSISEGKLVLSVAYRVRAVICSRWMRRRSENRRESVKGIDELILVVPTSKGDWGERGIVYADMSFALPRSDSL